MGDYILRSKAIDEFINCISLVPPSYVIKILQEIPDADVAPRTDLGALATARAIELLAASMEFLRNMEAFAGSEKYMSALCEYDETLNDGYCLLRDIEDFFEIVEDEE